MGVPPPPAVAISVLDAGLFLVLGTVGFVMVVAVCAILLALIQVILPAPADHAIAGPEPPGAEALDTDGDV